MKTIFVVQPANEIPLSEIREMYSIGAALHNEGLRELAKERGFERFDAKERYQAALKFAESVFPTVKVAELFSEAEFEKLDRKIYQWIDQQKPEKLADQLRKEGQLSAPQAHFLKLIYRILQAEKQEDLGKAVRKLQGLKVALLARKDLEDQAKAILFGALEIAIASAEFWAEAALDRDHDWYNPTPVRIPNWLADLGGFVAGALVGGAIAGPAGAIAGGVLVGEAASGKYSK